MAVGWLAIQDQVMTITKVLVHISDNLVRTAVKAVVAAEPDLTVTEGRTVPTGGAAGDENALPAVAVCTSDDSMGALLTTYGANARLPIIVLLPQSRYELIRSTLRSGATGLHCTNCHLSKLPNGLRVAVNGASWLAPCIAESVVDHISGRDAPTGDYGLTPREELVLKLMACGASNSDIGGELGLEIRTIKHHTSSILRKLGAREPL
jgi:DNA-binding NarL/FixJ family response regulator